jgi:hypothetical protein
MYTCIYDRRHEEFWKRQVALAEKTEKIGIKAKRPTSTGTLVKVGQRTAAMFLRHRRKAIVIGIICL